MKTLICNWQSGKWKKYVYGQWIGSFDLFEDVPEEGIAYIQAFEIFHFKKRQGHGTRMLKLLVEMARDKYKGLSLFVLKTNNIAIRMYEKVGFRNEVFTCHHIPSEHTGAYFTMILRFINRQGSQR